MRLRILAIGRRMPEWVDAGIEDYLRRFRSGLRPVVEALPHGSRRQGGDARAEEGQRLLSALDGGERAIALEVEGRAISTAGLSQRLADWRRDGRNVALLIGGADGLATDVGRRCEAAISLSALTLPHALARLLLIEQLYRAHSMLEGHPYHRE